MKERNIKRMQLVKPTVGAADEYNLLLRYRA